MADDYILHVTCGIAGHNSHVPNFAEFGGTTRHAASEAATAAGWITFKVKSGTGYWRTACPVCHATMMLGDVWPLMIKRPAPVGVRVRH